jgi:fructose-1,6-bisphosphatase/inositol monophosphatase family enzyme
MQSSEPDWETVLHLAITLARDAGAELRRRFGRQLTVTLKDELNPVTDADQAVETLIRQGIQASFPTHAIQAKSRVRQRQKGHSAGSWTRSMAR